jgi:hypothetical protein
VRPGIVDRVADLGELVLTPPLCGQRRRGEGRAQLGAAVAEIDDLVGQFLHAWSANVFGHLPASNERR